MEARRMIGVLRTWLAGHRLRRAGFLAVGRAALGVGAWFGRGWLVHSATAQQVEFAADPNVEPIPTDYATRVVAYIHASQAITRQELGEYLIVRYGAEKLPLLLNKRIVD